MGWCAGRPWNKPRGVCLHLRPTTRSKEHRRTTPSHCHNHTYDHRGRQRPDGHGGGPEQHRSSERSGRYSIHSDHRDAAQWSSPGDELDRPGLKHRRFWSLPTSPPRRPRHNRYRDRDITGREQPIAGRDRVATKGLILAVTAVRAAIRGRHCYGRHSLLLAAYPVVGAPPSFLTARTFRLAFLLALHDTACGRSLASYRSATLGLPTERPLRILSTFMAMKVTTDAVQVCSGVGFVRELPREQWMRDAKIFQILEGANQIQRMVIAGDLQTRNFVQACPFRSSTADCLPHGAGVASAPEAMTAGLHGRA